MLEILPITPERWPVLKLLRLRALADAPEAFTSTLAKEQALTDDEWQARARRYTQQPPAAGFLAYSDGVARGIALCFPSRADSGESGRVAELLAFWVDPAVRGQGVGAALVKQAAAWAVSQGFSTLHAGVMETNRGARVFYKKAGFHETGQRIEDEPDSGAVIALLRMPLAP